MSESRRRGRSDFWYEDDQIAASKASPGAIVARRERVRLLNCAVHAWGTLHQSQSEVIGVDAGCGDGINIGVLKEALSRISENCHVIAIDQWEARIGKAVLVEGTALLGEVTKLPLSESSVDLLLLSHVLEHVPDAAMVLREAKRVVRPGGCVVIAVPNEGCLLGQIRNRVLQRSIAVNTDHVHFFTMRSLKTCIEHEGGFRLLWTGREGFLFPHLRVSSMIRDSPFGRIIRRCLAFFFPSQSSGIALSLEVER